MEPDTSTWGDEGRDGEGPMKQMTGVWVDGDVWEGGGGAQLGASAKAAKTRNSRSARRAATGR
jgi:hypothetical protein